MDGLNKITQQMCSRARNRAAIWPVSHPVSEMWGTSQRITAPFRFKKGQHLNPGFSWKQNQAISEVQWAWVTLSFPWPPALFAHLFSSFLCFGTSGIVGSSRVRKQHCQNILRKEDCELFLAKQELEVSDISECPESLFSWELSFTPHVQEGQSSGIWRNPWWPNTTGTTMW